MFEDGSDLPVRMMPLARQRLVRGDILVRDLVAGSADEVAVAGGDVAPGGPAAGVRPVDYPYAAFPLPQNIAGVEVAVDEGRAVRRHAGDADFDGALPQ